MPTADPTRRCWHWSTLGVAASNFFDGPLLSSLSSRLLNFEFLAYRFPPDDHSHPPKPPNWPKMRGLSRLRAPASALSSSTCSLRTPLSSPAAAFSSASSQYTTQHISATRARVWQNTLQTSPRRCLSTATPRCDKQTTDLSTPEASTDLLEDEFYDDELVEGSEFDTDLVYPRAAVVVPTAQEITDPDYVPAESGDGLEEVGGLVDWWERPGHWGESKKYVGFGPVEKVGDPAVLEVLARRAVIEALAIKQYSKKSAKDKTAAALQAVIGQEELSSIEEVELAPGENNTVAVKDQDDLKIVWSSLSKAAPASAPSSPSISIHEARRLSRTWGNEWKAAVIQDPIVKFYVRLYPTPDPPRSITPQGTNTTNRRSPNASRDSQATSSPTRSSTAPPPSAASSPP